VNSQSGQVKLQNRKSSMTFSVFWIMKISNSPTPVSEAIATVPILSRCGSAAPPGVTCNLLDHDLPHAVISASSHLGQAGSAGTVSGSAPPNAPARGARVLLQVGLGSDSSRCDGLE
jgi:hypothetical protein